MSAGSDFWSRRKAAVLAEERRAEAEARRAAVQAEPDDAARLEAEVEGKTDEEILAELGLPDPDTLESGAEIRAFLAKAVPERIRRRALRRLWRTNPVLANLDALVDYGEDYTDSATVRAFVATAWKVGRGFADLADRLADADATQEPPEPGAANAQADAGAEAGGETARVDDHASPNAPQQPQTTAADGREEPAPQIPRRRRMTFEFPQESATT